MYGAADILDLKLTKSEGTLSKNVLILKAVKELFAVLKISKDLPTDPLTFQTFEVAHYVGFTIEQEYEFLRLASEETRQNYMLKHLKRILPVVNEMELLRQKARLNGHFKNIVPPKF